MGTNEVVFWMTNGQEWVWLKGQECLQKACSNWICFKVKHSGGFKDRKLGNAKSLQDDAFPFESGMFEIQDDADSQAPDPQVVDHLASFDVRDMVHCFGFDNYFDNYTVKGNEVGNVFANMDIPVADFEASLLGDGDSLGFEFHNQSVFVRLFQQSMSEGIQNRDGAAHDAIDFVLQQQFTVNRIHGDRSSM